MSQINHIREIPVSRVFMDYWLNYRFYCKRFFNLTCFTTAQNCHSFFSANTIYSIFSSILICLNLNEKYNEIRLFYIFFGIKSTQAVFESLIKHKIKP